MERLDEVGLVVRGGCLIIFEESLGVQCHRFQKSLKTILIAECCHILGCNCAKVCSFDQKKVKSEKESREANF